jgi:pSer/pThr/pTyr-binding forkhead associated (FHA) protein
MKISLVVAEGAKEGTVIPIPSQQFLIGRDPQCQLRPASDSVSKRHCAILVKNGKVFVKDLKSRNGTFVNDRRVEGDAAVVVKHGDQLRIGPLTFVVQIEQKAARKPVPSGGKPGTEDDEATDVLLGEVEPDADSGPESERIAAMLLDLADPAGATLESSGLAASGTKTDIPAVPDPDAAKPPDKKVPSKADTASAAAAILEKYSRRSRS